MNDYDFKSLNDKEFEALCIDLLGKVERARFERFKPGKDSGVDGRYFDTEGGEVVLQCKHWANTPTQQLISYIRTTERPKLDKLKPSRYFLAVSNPLSRADKKALFKTLSPYVESESDIFGREDLNDLISKDSSAEQRHYKLWLKSSRVLSMLLNSGIFGRSAYSLEEILQESHKYVITTNHHQALNKLEQLGVVVITGEPGVGKTTLANHLCLHYASRDYSYLKISDDIKEAESVFDPEQKQVFYFDDFLGRSYLEALRGHEGAQITQFIRRVATSKNKKFILTSRSTILNQGKLLIDSFEHQNINRNEVELKIQSLTELDKAHILYNHLWHSGLSSDYIEEIYKNKRYHEIIEHQNFNPRLISYILDSSRLSECRPQDYWAYITEALNNPSQVWDHPFIAQQDDFGRSLILLVVLHGSKFDEKELNATYIRFITIEENKHLRGKPDFYTNIRTLTGSFFNRTVFRGNEASIDLFNPSIADYIIKRYCQDVNSLRLGFRSLNTIRSLITLNSLYSGNQISKEDTRSICEYLLEEQKKSNFDNVSVAYLSRLIRIYIDIPIDKHNTKLIAAALQHTINNADCNATDDSFQAVKWGIDNDIISHLQGLDFLRCNYESIESYTEMTSAGALLSTLSNDINGYEEVANSIKSTIVNIYCESFSDLIDTSSAFSTVNYGDTTEARRRLEELIEDDFLSIGIPYNSEDISHVVSSYNIADGLHDYHINYYDSDDPTNDSPAGLTIDEIDDLFDRR